MKRLVGATAVLAALYLVGCGGNNTPPPELPKAPRIVSFEASKTELQQGEQVTLSYEVENATEVQLVDHLGQPVDVEGDAVTGSVTVTPAETSFYVLRALGEGGRATDFLQVAVGEDLKEVFLIAVPPIIDGGGGAQLLWSAHNGKTAKLQTSAGQEFPLPVENGAGVVDVTPARTLAYTLVASGVDAAQSLTASAEVKVRPVISSFTIAPAAARPGESLTLQWKTRGASQVSVTEATFGEVGGAAGSGQFAQVDEGQVVWTVPETMPGSDNPVAEGLPLRFTLTATSVNPNLTLTRTIDSFVGDGPRIESFQTPVAISEGDPIHVSWKTFNATRLVLFADGHPIYEPLPADAEILEGSYTLPSPLRDVALELRVWNHLGAHVSESREVALVKLPVILQFDMPAFIPSAGTAAQASWSTENAHAVSVRVKAGPSLFRTEAPAQVSTGSTELYPGLRTTFVLEAYNAAGARVTAEQTVDVVAPGLASATPAPSFHGESVTVTWQLDSSAGQVLGIPSGTPVPSNPGQAYLDLNMYAGAESLVFDSDDEGVAQVPLQSQFLFPLAGGLNHRYFVSTNGFISFGPTDPLPNNESLDAAAQIPSLIAPFWDDLRLGENGQVLWVVDGQTFPRRLIIQWDKVQLANEDTSQLTFQVQLWETGQMTFSYPQLDGADAPGNAASIGFRVNDSLASELANAGAAFLNAGDELSWFGAGSLTGTLTYVPERSGAFTIFAQRPVGGYVVYPVRVNPLKSGSVLINEVMLLPDVSAPQGQWLELANSTDDELDISGTVITAITTGTSFTLPEGSVLEPGGFLVLGESDDPTLNGHAEVDVVWTDLVMQTAGDGSLVLTANGSTVSEFHYLGADLLPNQSLQSPEHAIDAVGDPVDCTRSQTFGFNGAVGTPGAPNEVCFEYGWQTIPSSYEDIRTTGTELLGSSTTGARQYTLEAPFPYFGQTFNEVSISSAGFLAFGQTLTDDHDNPNDVVPGSAVPNGVVAPFWGRLIRNSTNISTAGLVAERRSDHTIIAWHNFRLFNGGSSQSQLHFMVKLFDSGIIEFHYGDMLPTTASSCNCPDGHTGGNSTIWIERPDGSAALPIGINQAGTLQPGMGFRFIPNK